MRNSIRSSAALLAVFSLATGARAGYDARAGELREMLAKETFEGQERELLGKAADEWLKARNEYLDKLVALVAETRLDEQEREWVARVGEARSKLKDLFDSAWSSLSGTPSVGAMHFVNIVRAEEDRFLAGLAGVKVAEGRDYIVKNQRNVEEQSRALQEKWRSLTEQEKGLFEQELKIACELEEMIKKVVDEAVVKNRTAREKVESVVAVGVKLGAAAIPNQTLSTLADAVADLALLYVNAGEYARTRTVTFSYLMDSDAGGIYPLFLATRQETQEFVEKNDFLHAKERWQLAKDALERLVSDAATSAQKSDAGVFKEEILRRLSTHLTLTELTFNEFVSRHRSRFFGPISDETLEAIAEPHAWENEWRVFDQLALDAKLREWRRLSENYWDADLSGVSDEAKASMKEHVRGRLDELIRALSEEQRLGQETLHLVRDRADAAKKLK
jgi:hypothetical protein